MKQHDITISTVKDNSVPSTAVAALASGVHKPFGMCYDDVKGLPLSELEKLVRMATAKIVEANNEVDNIDQRYSYAAWAEQRKKEKYEVVCRAENAQGDLWLAAMNLCAASTSWRMPQFTKCAEVKSA